MALPTPAATSVVTMGYRGASRQTQVMDMDQAGFLKQTTLFSGFSDRDIASVLGTAKALLLEDTPRTPDVVATSDTR